MPVRRVVLGLFAVGAGLRVWTLLTWRPAFIGYYDTAAYVDAAQHHLFRDAFRPAGYPLFLRALHALSDRVVAVTIAQHVLGLATAALLYLAVRRVTGRAWAALIPAAVVALDGFQILLEHALLSDALFAFLLAAALYASVRGGWRWALAAGALVAAAGLVRTVGLFAAPVIIAGAPRRMAAGAVAAVLVLGAYAVAHGTLSLTRAGGWGLYARVGQFADCRRFAPPAGTASLCERRVPAERPGTDFYFWSPDSPAQQAFGAPPRGDARVGAFAHAALVHQPGAYLAAVASDFARYVAPEWHERPRAGQTEAEYIAQAHSPHEQAFVGGRLSQYYRDVPGAHAGVRVPLGVRGPLLALLLVLAAAAPFLDRRATRFSATAWILLLVPVATQVYDARYALAALGPLSAAAALAAASPPLRRRAARAVRAVRSGGALRPAGGTR